MRFRNPSPLGRGGCQLSRVTLDKIPVTFSAILFIILVLKNFSASNQVGEMMKKNKRIKPKTETHQEHQQTPSKSETPELPDAEII